MNDSTDTLAEFGIVTLTEPLPEHALPAGQTGTIVHVHDRGEAFEIEFILQPSRSVVATVRRAQLLKLHGLPAAVAG